MKFARHGKAEPMRKDVYLRLREAIKEGYKILLDIAFYTGERWGAILQLRVEDIYLDPIKRSLQEQLTFRASIRKDRTTRQVPLHPDLQLRLRAVDPPKEGWMFASPRNPGKPKSFQAADLALRAALRTAGLQDAGYSTHSFRRGFITALHDNGVSPKVIQSLTGHRSLNVVSGYIDVSDGQRLSAIKSL